MCWGVQIVFLITYGLRDYLWSLISMITRGLTKFTGVCDSQAFKVQVQRLLAVSLWDDSGGKILSSINQNVWLIAIQRINKRNQSLNSVREKRGRDLRIQMQTTQMISKCNWAFFVRAQIRFLLVLS